MRLGLGVATVLMGCLLSLIWFTQSVLFPQIPPEQCEPLNLLVTLEDLPQGTVISAIVQPATDYQLPSAGVALNVKGSTVSHSVVWHKAIWTAWGNFKDVSNFSFKRGPNGVRDDIPEGLLLPPLHADESHIGCGMTVIGRVCAFAARYSNIVAWLQVELASDNRVDEFAHLVGVIDARMQSCIASD